VSGTSLLCAPSVRSEAQQALHELWCLSLESMGFRIEMLRRADYLESPWEQLMDLLARVDGVVVLGFRQMDIRDGLWRGGTVEMETVSAVWTSPWMHVEAGMAIASNKPVLVAPERGVTEGVFAQHNWTENVFGSNVENPRSPGVERWAAAVRQTRVLKAGVG
jgi:hypothetical protein